jgi:ribosome-binding protein aMBF1 (putative translation factor)
MTINFEGYIRDVERQATAEEAREIEAARARFRLGTKVLQQRLTAGLTQQQLANESGIAQADISRIEHGLSNPTADTLEAIARPLGITLDLVPAAKVKKAAEV